MYLKTKKKYIKHVCKILQALKKTDLRIKSSKNKFYVQNV